MAIAPPVTHYTTNPPYMCFVPILDGVAAKLLLANHPTTREFQCGHPSPIITNDFAPNPKPLEAWPTGGATWTSLCTEVKESTVNGKQYIHAVYTGAAIPAMTNNVVPAGWEILLHPWGIRDTSVNPPVNTGFYRAGGEPGEYFSIYFVPHFKIVAASTTQTLTDGSDQYWYLYLAKPLNYNQKDRLVSTATSSWGAQLTVGTETNEYGQVTALKILVPLGAVHPTQAANTIHVKVLETLYYLKGEVFVTETITHLDKDFSVQITLTPDTTAPTFSRAKVQTTYEAGQPGGRFLWVNAADSTLTSGHRDMVGARISCIFDVSDPGTNASGLDRLEVWMERAGATSKISSTPLNGAKSAGISAMYDIRADTMDCPANYATYHVTAKTRFLAKLYDKAGQVATRYLDPPTVGQTQEIWAVSPHCSLISSNGNYNGTAWTNVTALCAQVHGVPFITKVEFYVDNVLVGTTTAPTPSQAFTYPDLTGLFWHPSPLSVGTHTVKVMLYDGVDRATTPVHTLTSTFVVTAYGGGGGGGGGGGCVDYGAQILMGDGTTKDAFDVQVGDLVMTRNPITAALEPKPVRARLLRGVQPCYRLVGEDGSEAVVSATHRIYIPSKQGFCEAQDLRVLDAVLKPSGDLCRLAEIVPIEKREVLTFTIDDPDNRNYFADGILAHNMKSLDCVLPDTLITMEDRTEKPIKEVVEGDRILAWNTLTKEFEPDTVISTFITKTNQLYVVELEDGKSVTCTGTHVLYAGGLWLSVKDLLKFNTTPRVMVNDGSFQAITKITPVTLDEGTEVRLVEVRNNHNLVVAGMICHNIIKGAVVADSQTALYVDGVLTGYI